MMYTIDAKPPTRCIIIDGIKPHIFLPRNEELVNEIGQQVKARRAQTQIQFFPNVHLKVEPERDMH